MWRGGSLLTRSASQALKTLENFFLRLSIFSGQLTADTRLSAASSSLLRADPVGNAKGGDVNEHIDGHEESVKLWLIRMLMLAFPFNSAAEPAGGGNGGAG